MKLIVGLGNPGPKYETTRHNVGFLAIDRLIDDYRAHEMSDASQGEIWQATIEGEKTLLVKPQTFMNVSGKCVGPLFKFYKLEPADLIVIYDDVDLKAETLRIKTGGGAGGHNGIKSIDQYLGNEANAYHRMRIGIGRPPADKPGMDTASFVLEPFSDLELARLDFVLEATSKAVALVVRGDVLKAMNEFNKKSPVD